MKYFNLTDQIKIPVLGFGTWQLTGSQAQESVEKALQIGYRHIDTADAYGNHKEVARAIGLSGINRNEIFITTKIWRTELNREKVISSTERFLEELNITYIDLLLVHWPNSGIAISETLEAMDELKKREIIRAIGVSNFTIRHLGDALESGIQIDNNQVEFHPSLNQKELKSYCDKQHILLTAYSPIAQGKDFKLDIVRKLSYKYNRSPSQVILNWIISKGIVVIPRSSKSEHIDDNFKTLEWELEKEDVEAIDSIGVPYERIVNPEFSEFDYR